jgi:hypothetical protein
VSEVFTLSQEKIKVTYWFMYNVIDVQFALPFYFSSDDVSQSTGTLEKRNGKCEFSQV